MECFLVAPSEAVLAGLCLEEYLALKTNDPTLSFLTVLNARITPFTPRLMKVRLNSIPESEIPDDVSWLPIDGMQIGTSGQESNVFYGINEKGAYRKRIRHSRCFSQLLTCFLAPHLGMAPWMREVTEQSNDVNCDITSLSAVVIDGVLSEEDQDSANVGIRGDEDKTSELSAALSSLMSYNNSLRFFEIGRSFGRLISGISLYKGHQSHPLFAIASITQALIELNKVPEVQRSVVAQNAFASILSPFMNEIEVFKPAILLFGQSIENGAFSSLRFSEIVQSSGLSDEQREKLTRAFDPTEQTERKHATLPAVDRLLPSVWVALGEILAMFRDLDQDVMIKDSANITPRAFISDSDDSPEKLRRNLAFWESALAGGMVDYEQVVPGLSVAIESLAKRLWQKEYQLSSKNRNTGLSGLLKDKFLNSTSLVAERRFASLAFSLYKGYRNEAVHEMESFEISLAEARYFVAGIRALLDLFDSIMLARA